MQNYWDAGKAHMFNKHLTYWIIREGNKRHSYRDSSLAPQAWENVQIYFESDKKDKYKYHLPHNCVWNWY